MQSDPIHAYSKVCPMEFSEAYTYCLVHLCRITVHAYAYLLRSKTTGYNAACSLARMCRIAASVFQILLDLIRLFLKKETNLKKLCKSKAFLPTFLSHPLKAPCNFIFLPAALSQLSYGKPQSLKHFVTTMWHTVVLLFMSGICARIACCVFCLAVSWDQRWLLFTACQIWLTCSHLSLNPLLG